MKKIDSSKSVWYDRYTPFFIDDMIIPEKMKNHLNNMIKTEKLTHLALFSNIGGLGKSALSHAILKEVDGEALWINASLEKGIDVIRNKISKFASSSSFDDKQKIVVMDEFDNFSQDGQKAFRGFIDEFGSNCTFIFTGNYKDKIIEPLLTRLEIYDFQDFSKQDIVLQIFNRLTYILQNEKIEYDNEDIKKIISTFYPSIRSMIGALQQYSLDGKLQIDENLLDNKSNYEKVIILKKPNTYFEMVQEINQLSSPDNMYKYMYNNANNIFKTENYPKAIIILAKYQSMSSQVRDKHLNLCACLTELINL